MKQLIAALALCAFATSADAQITKYGVKVKEAKHVDFASFKTYTWTVSLPSVIPGIDAVVTAAIERELTNLGMTKVASGGDVLVTYTSLNRTDVNLKAKRDADGLYPERWVGTLVISFLDPANQRPLLKLRMDRPIDIEPAPLEASIDEAVVILFARYPTRQQR